MNSPSTVDIDFMTGSGQVPGPQGYVVCERAMYDSARTWAHDSIVFGYNPI